MVYPRAARDHQQHLRPRLPNHRPHLQLLPARKSSDTGQNELRRCDGGRSTSFRRRLLCDLGTQTLQGASGRDPAVEWIEERVAKTRSDETSSFSTSTYWHGREFELVVKTFRRRSFWERVASSWGVLVVIPRPS